MKLKVSIAQENAMPLVVEVDAPDCNSEAEAMAQISAKIFPDVQAAGGRISVTKQADGTPHFSATWPESVYIRRAVEELHNKVGIPEEPLFTKEAIERSVRTGEVFRF